MTGLRRPSRFWPGQAISLRRFQRDPAVALGIHGHKRVRIWSNEHCAYWRYPANGYTEDVRGAGEYDAFDAYRRTRHCGPEKQIWFEFVKATGGNHA